MPKNVERLERVLWTLSMIAVALLPALALVLA